MKKADSNVCELLDHGTINNNECMGTAKQKWEAYIATRPKRDLPGLGCANDDAPCGWANEMGAGGVIGAEKMKEALCEFKTETDECTLESMTESLTGEFGGFEK